MASNNRHCVVLDEAVPNEGSPGLAPVVALLVVLFRSEIRSNEERR